MKKMWFRSLLLSVAMVPAAVALAHEAPHHQQPLGWIEKVTLEPWDVEVKAKLDSGALTSSLDARDIETFEREGEEWVRFRLKLENEANDERFTEVLERPLYREQTVRGAGGRDERAVVLMEICVGERRYEEQFSLRNREDMNYPMLLGRRTIGHLGALDVRKTFTTEPDCDADSPLTPYDPDEE